MTVLKAGALDATTWVAWLPPPPPPSPRTFTHTHTHLNDGVEGGGVGCHHLGGLSLMHEEVDGEEDGGVLAHRILLQGVRVRCERVGGVEI